MKGRLLSEAQVAEVVSILKRNQALFEVSIIDLGAHSDEGLRSHQKGLAEAFVANLTEEHHPTVVAEIHGLCRELLDMKLPGYVQSVLTFQVLRRVLEHATLYHCQRNPQELGSFSWVVDAKDRGSILTPWEKWWQKVLLPTIQSWSLSEPGAHFVGGDYRFYEPFLDDQLPEHLQPFASLDEDAAPPINLRKIFADMRFSSSADMGLELVDVLTNAIRRALVGNLQPAGWMPIRQLMIHRSQQYIAVIGLNADERYRMGYEPVLRAFKTGGRGMLTQHHLRSS